MSRSPVSGTFNVSDLRARSRRRSRMGQNGPQVPPFEPEEYARVEAAGSWVISRITSLFRSDHITAR